jgi:hypothetical protein
MRINLEKLEADIGRAIAWSQADRPKDFAGVSRVDVALTSA